MPLQTHDREVLCCDIRGYDLVTGSADHAAHLYDLKKKELRRRLFTKQYGHHEWVTCCSFAYDGRIVTGGMDSVVCMWDKSIPKCIDCTDHEASVSQVICDPHEPVCISSSYDKTLKVWNINTHQCIKTFTGHTGAVNDFTWRRSLALSIGRDGLLIGWDVNSGQRIATVRHSSHVAAVSLLNDEAGIIATGTQDGTVGIYDLRDFKNVASQVAHNKAVSAALAYFGAPSPSLVSAGSDKNIVVLDATMGWKQRAVLTGHAAPIQALHSPSQVISASIRSAFPVPGLIVSGGANGWVVIHDANTAVDNTPAQYAFGALKGGVRCLKTTGDGAVLVVGGDDPEPVVVDYNV